MAAAEAVRLEGRKRVDGFRVGGHKSQSGVRPHQANSKLPSGTRALRSVLSGRGESSGHSGATTLERLWRGIPRGKKMETQGGRAGCGARGAMDRVGGMGQWVKGVGRASKPSKAREGGSSCSQGWAPAGACTRLATGMAAGKTPQTSRSCWQPVRAAASRATCAAGRPPLPGTPVQVGQGGRTRTRRRNRSAKGGPASQP